MCTDIPTKISVYTQEREEHATIMRKLRERNDLLVNDVSGKDEEVERLRSKTRTFEVTLRDKIAQIEKIEAKSAKIEGARLAVRARTYIRAHTRMHVRMHACLPAHSPQPHTRTTMRPHSHTAT